MSVHRMEDRLDVIIEIIVGDKPTSMAAQKAKMEALDKYMVKL